MRKLSVINFRYDAPQKHEADIQMTRTLFCIARCKHCEDSTEYDTYPEGEPREKTLLLLGHSHLKRRNSVIQITRKGIQKIFEIIRKGEYIIGIQAIL